MMSTLKEIVLTNKMERTLSCGEQWNSKAAKLAIYIGSETIRS